MEVLWDSGCSRGPQVPTPKPKLDLGFRDNLEGQGDLASIALTPKSHPFKQFRP